MRIGLAVVLALSLTPAPLGTAAAQSPERAARVGYLYPTLLADLVRLKVDVLVTQSGEATKAAQAATKTIPIVMSMVMDPVGSGIVPSLARPGGNVTGTSYMAPDLVGKQLEVLKEVEAEAAARILGVRLQILDARNAQEIDRAFAAMTRQRAGRF